MLVALRICGRWNGKKYVFDGPSVRKVYKGPIARALGGSGGGTTQEFTPTGPWSQQVPYIQGLFQQAAGMYNQGAPQYFPGSTVAPTAPNLGASQQNIYGTTGTAFGGQTYGNQQYQAPQYQAPPQQGGVQSIPASQPSQPAGSYSGLPQNYGYGTYNIPSPTMQTSKVQPPAVTDGSVNPGGYTGQYPMQTAQPSGTSGILGGAMQQAAMNQQTPTMAGQVGAGQIMPYNTAINQLLQSSIANPTQSLAGSALPAFYGGLQQAGQQAAPVSTPGTDFGNINANPALLQSMYSNGMNPFTSQIVDAALRASNRQFGENVIPQIATQANMAGQLGGTRQGVAEGIAAENQTQMQKDLIAQLYGQAFDVGSQERLAALGLAGQGQQANANLGLGAQQLAEQQRQATMQSGLGQSQLVGNLMGQGQQLGQQGLGQAGQLAGNMIGTGSAQNLQSQVQNAALLPGLNQGINANLGIANQTALQEQAQAQAMQDAAVERWFYEQYAPYNMLTQYQNWVTGPYGASRDMTGYGNNPNSPLSPYLQNIMRNLPMANYV